MASKHRSEFGCADADRSTRATADEDLGRQHRQRRLQRWCGLEALRIARVRRRQGGIDPRPAWPTGSTGTRSGSTASSRTGSVSTERSEKFDLLTGSEKQASGGLIDPDLVATTVVQLALDERSNGRIIVIRADHEPYDMDLPPQIPTSPARRTEKVRCGDKSRSAD